MIHTKAKDVITRTQALMIAFGWQGGTIHQIAEETGCDAHDLIYAESEEYSIDNRLGWFAYLSKAAVKKELKISMKVGTSDQFRDKVELNQIMRNPNARYEFKIEPRKGYKLVTFEIV